MDDDYEDEYQDDFIQTKQPERNQDHINSTKNLVVEVKDTHRKVDEDDYEDDFGADNQNDFTSRKAPERNQSHIESASKLLAAPDQQQQPSSKISPPASVSVKETSKVTQQVTKQIEEVK